jgi:GntR family transcriptional regulator
MPKWIPDLSGRSGSIRDALIESLEAAISSGILREGDTLPSQRLLADFLKIHVNTVNRAFVGASRRGLIEGRCRRGTIVRGVVE